ncbi:hypothetical protein CJ030_MR2G025691 [Morella rubra]|uniref:Uncharacterized protein n=1 Tax=Morella rubra TaxID=262757 RepID=A0A6A1WDL7_9ROSI|nr:hypothetical protein CJ030_MR2G025691 [Morella rubra]
MTKCLNNWLPRLQDTFLGYSDDSTQPPDGWAEQKGGLDGADPYEDYPSKAGSGLCNQRQGKAKGTEFAKFRKLGCIQEAKWVERFAITLEYVVFAHQINSITTTRVVGINFLHHQPPVVVGGKDSPLLTTWSSSAKGYRDQQSNQPRRRSKPSPTAFHGGRNLNGVNKKHCHQQKSATIMQWPLDLDDVFPWRKTFCDSFEGFLPRLLPWADDFFLRHPLVSGLDDGLPNSTSDMSK